MAPLIDHVPRHLLDELVEGSWLPIVGAGFSRNAIAQGGDPPVSWLELGAALRGDVDGADEASGTLEIISAFEQAFGRVALVDRTASLIRAYDSAPGAAHLAFARVGFTNVVTTNFDLLLERAYEQINKGCLPVVDETQLSTPNRYAGPRLIKFHGDINHPARMVITEEDYDQFLHSFPLLVTSVTAMLVERTGILVGYSLDDPDTRQILALIKRRLGPMYRPLWTVQIGCPAHVVSRFERRGVKVINLPKVRGISIGSELEQFFTELAQYWRDRLPEKSVNADDRVTADFRVPQEPSRICYFAIPAKLIGWYRDYIFPEVEANGLVPVTARDVFSPPGTTFAKLDTLIRRAAYVVAEIGDQASEYEVAMAVAQKAASSVLLVASELPQSMQPGLQGRLVLTRPARFEASPDEFVQRFRDWLTSLTREEIVDNAEPERLLGHREYGAALISAVSLLEVTLSERFAAQARESPRPSPLRSMLKEAERQELFISVKEQQSIEEAVNRRNQTIHTTAAISGTDSRRLVNAIRQFVDRLRSGDALVTHPR
ncbi:SIR2 family NAD-dependent protein deacylase [Rhodococcus sp. AW25M09]|uniref:SIR2 family NAD-dependent protein deacylase n=1 Tax=Rhodococcus sp. AW25M09 TaxID=1268303 RepID=UPI0012FC3DFB|nr:SIR2 family protein [Rhodococcus sp. AW25M09]